jgi:DNA repair exonuclease SbcCD ATPase subunit
MNRVEQPMNRVEETASMPSMSARASTTRAQVARIADEDVRQMAAQLEHWGTQLDELVAKTGAPGVDARIDFHEGIDDLKTKYAIARARLDELKTAGAKWEMLKSSIERAWNDLEGAFENWAN